MRRRRQRPTWWRRRRREEQVRPPGASSSSPSSWEASATDWTPGGMRPRREGTRTVSSGSVLPTLPPRSRPSFSASSAPTATSMALPPGRRRRRRRGRTKRRRRSRVLVPAPIDGGKRVPSLRTKKERVASVLRRGGRDERRREDGRVGEARRAPRTRSDSPLLEGRLLTEHVRRRRREERRRRRGRRKKEILLAVDAATHQDVDGLRAPAGSKSSVFLKACLRMEED